MKEKYETQAGPIKRPLLTNKDVHTEAYLGARVSHYQAIDNWGWGSKAIRAL